jgi:acetolactate synthase-1/2/3 large subunit
MVDIDEAELKKPTLQLHMPIHADAKLFIDEMLFQLGDLKLQPKGEWIKWCEEIRYNLPSILEDNRSDPDYVNSYEFADTLFKFLTPGMIVVTGNGTAYTGTYQIMHIKKGVRVFTNQACASMGYDLPAAIGACFAIDKRPVVLITGDGSIQMNIQELQTIVFHNLPIKVFVLNNNGYLAIRITQNNYFEGRHFGSCPQGGITFPDICKVAEAYGLPTTKILTNGCLSTKISEILSMPGPCICEVRMDPNQTPYPKLSSIAKSDGTMVSSPLEDMFPFLPRDEFQKRMIIPPLDQ